MSDIYLSLTETPSVVTLSQPVIASSVAATVTVGNTVTVALDANSLSALENVTVTVGAAVSVSNFPSTQTIAGTVTANAIGYNYQEDAPTQIPIRFDGSDTNFVAIGPSIDPLPLPISGTVTVENSVTIGSLPPISGTVTANGGNFLNADNALITKDSASNIVLVGGLNYSATPTQSAIDAIRTDGNGAVVVYSSQTNWTDTNAGNQTRSASQQTPFPVQILGGSVTVGSLPSGALTTRFGSVTTANTAQITSAVTNTSRKYLLAQNISAGTVTIGIGFSPTTTQGIQLTAGAGLTFDSFCPTGAVYWLGAVTGAAFTILEG